MYSEMSDLLCIEQLAHSPSSVIECNTGDERQVVIM